MTGRGVDLGHLFARERSAQSAGELRDPTRETGNVGLREAENFADNLCRKRGGELIENVHLPLRVDAVNEIVGDRAHSRPQPGDQSGRKCSRQRGAAPAMVRSVRQQHAVVEEVE